MVRIIIQLGRSRLILALIISMGIVFGYLSYSGSDELVVIPTEDPTARESDFNFFRGFVLDFSLLDDERYKSLQIFGENPVDPGITGERRNPFAPL